MPSAGSLYYPSDAVRQEKFKIQESPQHHLQPSCAIFSSCERSMGYAFGTPFARLGGVPLAHPVPMDGTRYQRLYAVVYRANLFGIEVAKSNRCANHWHGSCFASSGWSFGMEVAVAVAKPMPNFRHATCLVYSKCCANISAR